MSDEQTIRDALAFMATAPMRKSSICEQDAIAALDRLVAERDEAEMLAKRWEAALARAEAAEKELEAALAEIEAIQPRLVGWLRDNGIVFRRAPLSAPPESDDERWEQIAFSIYTHVCEADSAARAALAASQPAEKEGTAFERSLLRADIKAGNADAAEAQLQRIKRLEAGTTQTEDA